VRMPAVALHKRGADSFQFSIAASDTRYVHEFGLKILLWPVQRQDVELRK
jgi:hypothetical protein